MAKLFALLLSLALLFPAIASASDIVYIHSYSKRVKPVQIANALPAFQSSIDEDLGPIWGVSAVLTTDPSSDYTMEMVIVDNADCPCYGFHTNVTGLPLAIISAKTAQAHHEDWRLTASHELDEMLVDPFVDRKLWIKDKQWIVEVADPVESGADAYFKGNVPLSDFVTPAWFTGGQGPYDFTGVLRKPGQLARGGYLSWWDMQNRVWNQSVNMI